MNSPLKSAILRACQKILEPMARILIEAGFGVGDFHALAKRAFVKAALESSPEAHRPNISRIASVTGLSRGEVAAILAESDDAMPDPARGRQRAERVLTGWWTDPEFISDDGRPAHLPLRGTKRSFAALVKRYSGDPRTVTLLDELIRVKAVRRLPDGQLEALSRTYATARWDPASIERMGEVVHDHFETLSHNLKHPSRPRYERVVMNTQLDPRYAPMLIRDLTEQVDALANSLDDAINQPAATLTPGRTPKDGMRLGVAIYVVEEATVIEPPPPPTETKPARGRRSSTG